MSYALMPQPKMQFFSDDGAPLSGGYLYSYQAGAPGVFKPTTMIADGTAINTNPLVLDSAGRASVWLQGYYYMELWTGEKDAVGSTLIWAQDNISTIGGTYTGTGFDVVVVQVNPNANSIVLVDASVADRTVTLPTQGNTTVIKIDDSANTVTLVAPDGKSFSGGAPVLTVKNETTTLTQEGSTYYILNDNTIIPFYSVIVSTASPTAAQLVILNSDIADVSYTLISNNTEYIITRQGTGVNAVTINAPYGYTIDNSSTYTLDVVGESVHLLLSATNYILI